MQRFVDAVRSSLEAGHWLSALTLALTLPDICGRLESPTTKSERRYSDWWNKYLLASYQYQSGAGQPVRTFLSAGDVYALRCSHLHEGTDDTANQRAQVALTQFHFIEPPTDDSIVHCNQLGDTLQLQIDIFCRDICAGGERWLDDVKGDRQIQARMDRLLSIHQWTGSL